VKEKKKKKGNVFTAYAHMLAQHSIKRKTESGRALPRSGPFITRPPHRRKRLGLVNEWKRRFSEDEEIKGESDQRSHASHRLAFLILRHCVPYIFSSHSR
jgi:hypothetical protein